MGQLSPRAYKLGDKIKCKAFLTKVKDGVMIQRIAPEDTVQNQGAYIIVAPDHPIFGEKYDQYCLARLQNWSSKIDLRIIPPELLLSCDGSGVEKTYYAREEKEFEGIVVEYKDVVAKALLYTDINEDAYHEWSFVGKEPTYIIPCVKVYYAFGKTRLVPKDDTELLPKERCEQCSHS